MFEGGAFSPFPPGSKCLFSSLVALCLRFSGVAAVEEMSANVFVSSARSVGEEILPPWFEPTPAIKMPEAVVRSWSHVPSFGGHYCPGVSRPVPADGDSSSPRSGSILPSLLSNLKHTSDGMSGLGGQVLQCCTVLTGVTVTCVYAASRLRFSTYRLITASSSSGSFPFSP